MLHNLATAEKLAFIRALEDCFQRTSKAKGRGLSEVGSDLESKSPREYESRVTRLHAKDHHQHRISIVVVIVDVVFRSTVI